jgi:hypothetical protein
VIMKPLRATGPGRLHGRDHDHGQRPHRIGRVVMGGSALT